MAWKEVRNNKEPDFRDDPFFGTCPRFRKQAKVIVHTVGTRDSKYDLQNTYHKKGITCSLLEGKHDFCTENCPLVTEKY